jgi:integrase
MIFSLKISFGGLFNLNIRYTYLRGNNYYYQRKIPRDLLCHYAGSSHIKIKLKTDNLNQIAKQVGLINKQYESVWASLRSNPDNTSIPTKMQILELCAPAKEHRGLDSSQLSTLVHACKNKDDDVRWLLALQLGLGCKLAEVAGLALNDLRLNVGLPYVSFQSNPWRVFKNISRKRNGAAYKIVESAKRRQFYAFPRYTNGNECNMNAASATINKWIRSLGIDKTTHDLQYTMRGRLGKAGVPMSIQDFIGGYDRKSKVDDSRITYGLEQLKIWLDKAAIIT